MLPTRILTAALICAWVGAPRLALAEDNPPASAWSNQAAATAQHLFAAPFGHQAARRALAITHPTLGERPVLQDVQVEKLPDRVVVTLRISWTVGLIERRCSTVVRWEFAERGHLRARVIREDAIVSVTRKASTQLDNYFRDRVYPEMLAELTSKVADPYQ